jgi:hypothetical protein
MSQAKALVAAVQPPAGSTAIFQPIIEANDVVTIQFEGVNGSANTYRQHCIAYLIIADPAPTS